jgi:hypothetical protein
MANQEQVEVIKRGARAWNKWRIQHREEIDFTNANLSSFQTRANLRGIDLGGVDLTGADLTAADLTMVDLTGANLRGATLTECDLTASYLMGTNFTQAICRHTVFTGVAFGQTTFIDVDLSLAKDLENAYHIGPSVIDVNTLYRSEGKMPEAFLRGVGVTENLIEYLPSLTGHPLQFYSCFISYSHADKSFARRLHDALQGRGIRCWLDEKHLLPGHNIYDEVDRGIRLWDKVLLCCSEHSLTSWWVDNEINAAFSKEQQLQKERGKKSLALIPLDLDGYLFNGWKDGKAQQVKSRLAADFKGWEQDNSKFEEQFERVVKALQTDDGREAPPLRRL